MTQMTFVIGGIQNPETQVRRRVSYGLERVENLIKQGQLEKAQERLNNLEAKFGDTFSLAELSSFLRQQAALKIELKDYPGALEDLYVIQAAGVTARYSVVVGNMIIELETLLAEQQATASVEDNGIRRPPNEE
ncbi:MAG: hypothetical protein AAFX54_07335 [Pseudomonadota bacterium]